MNSLDPSLNLGQWTEEEDAKLKAAITEHGYCWSKIAACIPPRTDNQCRRCENVDFNSIMPYSFLLLLFLPKFAGLLSEYFFFLLYFQEMEGSFST